MGGAPDLVRVAKAALAETALGEKTAAAEVVATAALVEVAIEAGLVDRSAVCGAGEAVAVGDPCTDAADGQRGGRQSAPAAPIDLSRCETRPPPPVYRGESFDVRTFRLGAAPHMEPAADAGRGVDASDLQAGQGGESEASRSRRLLSRSWRSARGSSDDVGDTAEIADGPLSPDSFRTRYEPEALARRKLHARRELNERLHEKHLEGDPKSPSPLRTAVAATQEATEAEPHGLITDQTELHDVQATEASSPDDWERRFRQEQDDERLLDELLGVTGGPPPTVA